LLPVLSLLPLLVGHRETGHDQEKPSSRGEEKASLFCLKDSSRRKDGLSPLPRGEGQGDGDKWFNRRPTLAAPPHPAFGHLLPEGEGTYAKLSVQPTTDQGQLTKDPTHASRHRICHSRTKPTHLG
jgi:hypothetical protein